MNALFALLLFIPQIAAAMYLVHAEGWVSGLAFFLFSMVFIDLMSRICELTNQLWRRIFGS